MITTDEFADALLELDKVFKGDFEIQEPNALLKHCKWCGRSVLLEWMTCKEGCGGPQ